jgi:Ca2+-binding EF-hand superfamily protein
MSLPPVPKQQIDQLKRLFAIFDKDNDGFIDEKELKFVVRSVGLHPSDEEVKALLAKADDNHNGKLEFDEFVKFVNSALQVRLEDEKELVRAFTAFDKDGNGLIDANEVRASLKKAGTDLTDEQVKEIIKELDVDGDGQLNYMEFRMMLLK